jgi:hypothetical protein
MRTVSAAYESAIAAGGVRLCEIYELELATGVKYRYTDHDADITWDAAGNTYTAIPLKRGPIRFVTDGQYNEMEITLGILDVAVMSRIQTNILEASKITHKRIRWDASYAADEEITLGIWAPDVNFDRARLALRLVSFLDTLNMKVPSRNYQEPCNNLLFDPTCGLTRSNYNYAGTIDTGDRISFSDFTAGTIYKANFGNGDDSNPIAIGETITGQTNSYTAVVCNIVYLTATTGTIWWCEISNPANFNNGEYVDAAGDQVQIAQIPAEDTTLYEQGELEILTGNNAGERRPILSCSGSLRTVLWPFPVDLEANDTYNIYPGCDLTGATCTARFNNAVNWDGYVYVPPVEEVLF